MQARQLDTREGAINPAPTWGRASARRSMRISTHSGVPVSSARVLQEVPVTPVPERGDAGDTSVQEVVSPNVPQTLAPALKGKIRYEFQDDAWLNDAKPAAQEQNSPPVEKRAESTQSSASAAKGSIGRGHRLWGVVLRLSERIWQELCQMDTTSGGFVPVRTSAQVDLVRKQFLKILRQENVLASQMHSLTEVEQVLSSVLDEVLGYGPLELLMRDEGVSEIIVVGPRMICAERKGEMQETGYAFEDERHLLRIIEHMLRQAGRKMEVQRPTVDICLPDGSFVDIVMPPSAVKGPTITLRKRPRRPLSIADLIEGDVLTQEMADFLTACIAGRLNIAICGGRGAGKTTLLNALCACIPVEDWIVTIEDVPELQLSSRHVVSLVAQARGLSAAGRVTMFDLVKHDLYMRPQHLIVGECRGEETVELFSALGAGHDGALMTVYGCSLRDCLRRLEMMGATEEAKLSVSTVREQIARCLDVLVYVSRTRDGSYKVRNIAEVVGVEADVIRLQSIFHYRDEGMDKKTGKVKGTFERSGFCPTFLTRLEARGIELSSEMFMLRPA